MKKFLLLLILPLAGIKGFTQLNIAAGAKWINNGNVTVNITDLSMVNNGYFSAGNSLVKFTGNTNNNIGGDSTVAFYQIEIAKLGNSRVVLLSAITVNYQVGFTTGLLDLNQQRLMLAATASLFNENETSRVIAPNGGETVITLSLNKPANVNAGNLGAILSSPANLGTVIIKRGHQVQTGAGLAGSVHRYFYFQPANNTNLNASLRFKYFNAELNAQAEDSLGQFISNDNSLNWTPQSFTTRDSVANFVERTGYASLSMVTLGYDATIPPSVTGLVFNAKRKKPTEVELDWKTSTESNMQSYDIERRLDTEPGFTKRGFVNTKAPGGNSTTVLSYQYTDPNPYQDTSFYRLKIIDQQNNFTYSPIKWVLGKSKGGNNDNIEISDSSAVTSRARTTASLIDEPTIKKIEVGPNPNNGNFWFKVSGIEKEAPVTLHTIDGKIIQQFRVTNQQRQQVNGLRTGIYILKVEGMQPVRIIVQ